jgi:hypothetical protein
MRLSGSPRTVICQLGNTQGHTRVNCVRRNIIVYLTISIEFMTYADIFGFINIFL